MGKKKKESHSSLDQGQEETMEELLERIKSLETQLSKAEIKADKAEIKAEAFKTLIEVAESKGMPVRKKTEMKKCLRRKMPQKCRNLFFLPFFFHFSHFLATKTQINAI